MGWWLAAVLCGVWSVPVSAQESGQDGYADSEGYTGEDPVRKTRLPSGLPPYLASLYEVPLLNREQEAHLFRKFNFVKYRANKLRSELDPAHAKSSLMDEIERLYDARFYRMWMFYLAAAMSAFNNDGHMNVQIQLTKRRDTLPIRRDYMAARETELMARAGH